MGGISQPSGGIGIGQTWQDVAASRSFGVTYTNTTGKPIVVQVALGADGSHFDAFLTANIDGTSCGSNGPNSGSVGLGYFQSNMSIIVPSNSTYAFSTGTYGTTKVQWRELR